MLSLCPFVSLKMKRTRIDMTLAPCLNNVRRIAIVPAPARKCHSSVH
jgi:hypothetical protein